MLKAASLSACCVALSLVALAPARLLAQDPNAMPDSKYHLAIAKTHTVHANDNAILLKKYATGHKTVPSEVIQEHTGSMKYHLTAARKAYASLAKTAKTEGDPKKQADLAKELTTIDARLAKINDMVKKLETQTTAADEVAAESAKISTELATSRAATQAVDNNFYNMSSSDYYEDGLGHFVD
jgi:DNA repair ATPase RecN